MRRIERLRRGKRQRGGAADLTNGPAQRRTRRPAARKQALDEQLDLQHKCGGEMQTTVEKMQRRLKALRETAAVAPDTISDEGADEGELPDSSGLVGPP